MSRKIAHIFLWIPLVVVLLHSFVPHHHFTEALKVSVTSAHQCPESFLSDLFEFDLGSHHLEEYDVSRNELEINFEYQFIELGEIALSNAIPKDHSYFVVTSIPLQEQFHNSYKSLRAPPSALLC